MDKKLFRKKYLGEVTLKNGEHVKFLFPLTESDVAQTKIQAETTWNRLRKTDAIHQDFMWAIMDDLDLAQFRLVYAAVHIYGKNYWKIVWEQYLEKNKKIKKNS